jgi:Flp pilus assembly protein TadB
VNGETSAEVLHEHAAADASYHYGIPALIIVCVVGVLVLAVLLHALTRAVRELAAAGRLVGSVMALRSEAEARRDELAERTARQVDAIARKLGAE